ncbi:MAG: sodium:proton antiporter [Chthoniobacterales bacterium]
MRHHVKAICEEARVAIPSFLGYIVRYTIPWLLPVCLVISFFPLNVHRTS